MRRPLYAVLPSVQDRAELAQLHGSSVEVHHVEDPNWSGFMQVPDRFDVLAYEQRLHKAVATETQSASLFYSHDLASLLAAGAADAYDLIGPTLESEFLACHKGYFRKAADKSLETRIIDLDDAEQTLPDLSWPRFVKPSCLQFSLFGSRVSSTDELRHGLQLIRCRGRPWAAPYLALFERHVDKKLYPLAARHSAVIEEYVSATSQHAVEGWSDSEGGCHLWAVSDNNYFPGEGAPLDSNSVPSRLAPDRQAALFSFAAHTVRHLGLRRTFWNVEIWIEPGGGLVVTEVNGRIVASMTPLYRAVFGMSQYPAAVSLALGLEDCCTDLVPGSARNVGAMVSLVSARGGRVRELLDYEKLARLKVDPDICKISLMQSPDCVIDWTQSGGAICLVRMYVTARDYEALQKKVDAVRASVLTYPYQSRGAARSVADSVGSMTWQHGSV